MLVRRRRLTVVRRTARDFLRTSRMEDSRRRRKTMFFNSYAFLFAFLPVVWVVYMLLSGHPRAGVWWMVAASLFFYAMYRVEDVPLLLVSIGFNYSVSLLIVRYPGRPWLPVLG